MINCRSYGNPPFKIAVVHGGPGAPGEMAPVARELMSICSVLEPLQKADSVEGQVEELKEVLEKYSTLPIVLIGFSWGAWLSFILAANYPAIVKKLILIGSGGFEEKYSEKIEEIRLSRLTNEENKEIISLYQLLNNSTYKDKKVAFSRFGELFAKADSYDPIEDISEIIDFQVEIFQRVWQEAIELRRSGKLLELGKHIQCPVVAIHGDYDPHPAEGVQKPLSNVLKDFRFYLLEKCGHKPWIERQAKEQFYKILKQEIC